MSMALVKDEDSVINHYAGTFAAGSRRAVVRATGNLTVRSQAVYTMFGGGVLSDCGQALLSYMRRDNLVVCT